MHPLAASLNAILQKGDSAAFALLSQRGKRLYFPHRGILGQGAEAAGKRFNATIGIALEEDGTPMRLPSLEALSSLPPQDVFSYAPSFGKKELRNTWRALIQEKNPGIRTAISMPVVTHALTHALSVAGLLFVDPGDEILLPDLSWDNYSLMFEEVFEARLLTYPLFEGLGFNLDGLKKQLSMRMKKKILLLNFPNNPTGYTVTEKEADAIIAMIGECAQAGDRLLVLLDDAYFGLVYEQGILRESLFARLCNLHENVLAVKIDGVSKEEYAWGLRIGFITFGGAGLTPEAYKALEDKAAGAVRATISSAANVSQSMVLRALQSKEHHTEKAEKFAVLQRRFEACKQALSSLKGAPFRLLPCNSGYFLCLELDTGLCAESVRGRLLSEFDTGVIVFSDRTIRIAFSAVKTSDIPMVFANIMKACGK